MLTIPHVVLFADAPHPQAYVPQRDVFTDPSQTIEQFICTGANAFFVDSDATAEWQRVIFTEHMLGDEPDLYKWWGDTKLLHEEISKYFASAFSGSYLMRAIARGRTYSAGHGFDIDAQLSYQTKFIAHDAKGALEIHESSNNLHAHDQMTFELGGAFAPSKRLVEMWISNIKSLTDVAGVPSESVDRAVSDSGNREAFSQMAVSLLVSVAQELRFEEAPDTRIMIDNDFAPRFQEEFAELFLMLPLRVTPFLVQLKDELVEAIRNGMTIKGSWGRIYLEDDNLSYLLTAPQIDSGAGFIRAVEVG